MPLTAKIFDIKKFAVHDGPGIRTSVFFKGCPLQCWWCHNPESRILNSGNNTINFQYRCMNLSNLDVKKAGFNITVKELLKEIEKDTIFYDQSGGGVTFTGGEPLVQKDFLKAILTDCKNKNIHTAVDTSGYAKWDYFLEIIELVDLFLFDLKIFDETEHFKYTNVSSLPIRENLKKIIKLNKNIILRIPLIPDITDSEINLTQLREFIYAVNHIRQIHLLPYNRFGEEKYRKLKISYKFGTKRSQSDKQLRVIKKKFESYGFEVRIGG